MICGFCSYSFDPADAQEACGGCPLHRGCHLIRCPRCNYEMPPESKLFAWFKKFSQRPSVPAAAPDTTKEFTR